MSRSSSAPETPGTLTLSAVLTTSLLMVDAHGVQTTIVAAVVNILIAGVVFWSAGGIHMILGKAGSKTVSKIASLFLAAIAVMMIRTGVVGLVTSFKQTS